MCSAKFFKNLAVDSANLSESWVNWIRVISFQLFRFVCLLNSGAPRSTDHSAEQILSSREKHISPDDSGYQMIMTTLWNDVKCIQFPIQYLVGGLEHFLFFHILGIIWNVIIPTDELIFFQLGRYTTNQVYINALQYTSYQIFSETKIATFCWKLPLVTEGFGHTSWGHLPLVLQPTHPHR